MNSPMRILLCLVGLAVGTWLVPVPVQSLTGDLTNDPAKVIEKYLSLDKRGVRLTAHSYEAIKPYVAWEKASRRRAGLGTVRGDPRLFGHRRRHAMGHRE